MVRVSSESIRDPPPELTRTSPSLGPVSVSFASALPVLSYRVVSQGSHYFGMRKTQPRWVKASMGTLVTLSTVKVVLELWRLVLVYGVHLAEARIYSLYWRRHLQDPIILIESVAIIRSDACPALPWLTMPTHLPSTVLRSGALMVGLCLFVQAAQCSNVLAAETNPKGRTIRLVIRVMLFFLAFASLAVGISLNAFLHVSASVGVRSGLTRPARTGC